MIRIYTVPATISISRFYVPAPSTLLQGPCSSLLGKLWPQGQLTGEWALTGMLKLQMEVPGWWEQQQAAFQVVLISAMCILFTPVIRPRCNTLLLVPKDTLNTCHFLQTQTCYRGRSLLHSAMIGPPEETGLGNYASSQLTETHFQWVHASFPQRKVRFKRPSARR